MLRYIPPFILNRFEAKDCSGVLDAYVLLFDIADFTVIGTSLQKEGNRGAEELSRFLDMVFSVPIEIVNKYGGFVSEFAGDAVCAIFPEGKPECIISAVNSISAFFHDKTVHQTPFGDFALKVRQTVCLGDVRWQIFVNRWQNEYVFYGATLKELAELSSCKQDVVFSKQAAQTIGLNQFVSLSRGYRPVENEVAADANPKVYPFQSQTKARFINPRFSTEIPQNEIRSGAYCFANLEGIKESKREAAICLIQDLADRYGGFVNKYDATDKGLVGIILFGLPKSTDKTLDRICRFALKATECIPELAMGIASGKVFAGYTGSGEDKEYTALGHPMNLAARLMGKAHAGEVITDHYLFLELQTSYVFDFIGSIELKGISYPIRHYFLSKKLYDKKGFRESRFVGREEEMAKLRQIVADCLPAGPNPIVYVLGDAGIGKSRLVAEALKTYNQDEFHKFFCYCDAVLQKPLELIRQIVRSCFGFSFDQSPEVGLINFKTQWAALAKTDPELIRIESIIASLLGFEWPGSVWDILPPGEKPEQLSNAFISLMQALAKTKPVIIHLDDAQWIDAQSKDYFHMLSEAGITSLIIIAVCRYLDNGDRPDLELSRHQLSVLDLSILSEAGSRKLMLSLLGLRTLPEATFRLLNSRALGNPFFLEQLITYLSESDKIDARGEICGEVDFLNSFSISDIIGSRIDKLTENLRELVSNASVLGMEFNVKVLSGMLNNLLEEMLESGTSNRIWKDLDELRYIFSHILIKDVVYQRMLSDKLQTLHITAAKAMESIYADTPGEHLAEIALHYEKGNQLLKAAEFYNQAGCYSRHGYDLVNAEAHIQKALQIREQMLGAEHPDTITSLTDLAEVYYMQSNFDRVEPMALKALQIRERDLGAEHPDTVQAMLNVAEMYHGQGKYILAEPLFLRALDIREKLLGKNHGSIAEIVTDLGLLYGYQGRFDEAEPYFLRARDINESFYGKENRHTVDSLQNIARMYSEQGKYELVEPLCLEALAISEKILGSEHPAVSDSLDVLGYLYLDLARYDEAEPLFIRALDIRSKVLGADHPDTATSMGSLASLYHYQEQFEKAEPLFQRMLEIYEQTLGPDHPETATALNNLANNLDKQDKTGLAEPLYLRALAIQEETMEPDNPALANTLDNLGVMYGNLKKYEQAEPLYQRALDIREQSLGADHPATAHTLYNLGAMYKNDGRFEQAELLLLKALEIQKSVYGAGHPKVSNTLETLAELYEKTGESGKAEEIQKEIQSRS